MPSTALLSLAPTAQQQDSRSCWDISEPGDQNSVAAEATSDVAENRIDNPAIFRHVIWDELGCLGHNFTAAVLGNAVGHTVVLWVRQKSGQWGVCSWCTQEEGQMESWGASRRVYAEDERLLTNSHPSSLACCNSRLCPLGMLDNSSTGLYIFAHIYWPDKASLYSHTLGNCSPKHLI